MVAVLIPTYNNDRTLEGVVDKVLEYVEPRNVIVVNDGSTDKTKEILDQYNDKIKVFHHDTNQGKGKALRLGFEKALELGYTHVISLDSDGQHYPEDLPHFLDKYETEPNTLFIGSRNLEIEGMPAKNTFANKFSNFWFWFETGIKLDDTQSGFRLYPISIMPKKWYTSKFEFEIEAIVRSSWMDIPVKNIPIQVIYDKEERVTHFRPFRDFTRISILNTVLVTITLLYILPRNFIRSFKKKKFKDFLKEDVLGSTDSPRKKSLSLALGVFIGIIPIWGFQTAAVLFLAVALRLNKGLAFAASNISIPPMIPIIVFTSLKIGSFLTQSEIGSFDFTSFDNFKNHFIEYLIGSIILASITAIAVGITSYILIKAFNRNK